MNKLTLRELSETTGASRRAIQGYEKLGLIRAYGKTKSGYLLYDDEMVDRIKQIKILQYAGFTLKEIKCILEASGDERKKMLESQAKIVEEELSFKEDLLAELYAMVGKLE